MVQGVHVGTQVWSRCFNYWFSTLLTLLEFSFREGTGEMFYCLRQKAYELEKFFMVINAFILLL